MVSSNSVRQDGNGCPSMNRIHEGVEDFRPGVNDSESIHLLPQFILKDVIRNVSPSSLRSSPLRGDNSRRRLSNLIAATPKLDDGSIRYTNIPSGPLSHSGNLITALIVRDP